MSIVRKGVKGASLVAGGIALTQKSDIEKNLNTLTKVAGLNMIQNHVQHEQSMQMSQQIQAGQQQLVEVTYEGFGMLADGMNDGFNHISGQIEGGFNHISGQVNGLHNSLQVAAVGIVNEIGRVDENNAIRSHQMIEQIERTETKIVEAAKEMQKAVIAKLKESIDAQNLQNRMTASPDSVKAEEKVEKGAKFLVAYKGSKEKNTKYLEQALEQYNKAYSKDPFNVDAVFYSNLLKNKLGISGWAEGYKELFDKIKVELNEENERVARAKTIAYRASVSCPIDLIDAVESKLVIDFYPFAKQQLEGEDPTLRSEDKDSLLITLDAIKLAALFLSKTKENKIVVKETKTGLNWFSTCAKKWGTNEFYAEALQISDLMEVPATRCYSHHLEKFHSEKLSIIDDISSGIKNFEK